MIVSSRGRYALRILIELAEIGSDSYVPMKTIAQNQGLSLKYLERILPVLAQNGIVEGLHGKGGGYRLCRKPEAYTVGEILRLTDDLAPVSCLECGAEPCGRQEECRTIAMWSKMHSMINDYFDGITIADLMRKDD